MFATHWNANEKRYAACLLKDLGFKVERWARYVGWAEAVDEGGVLRWGRRDAEIAEDADEALEATVAGEDVAYAGRGGGEVREVGEGVEGRQRRSAVEG